MTAAVYRLAVLMAGFGSWVPGLAAQARLTQGEALRLAFPEAHIERKTAFLSEDDKARAEQVAAEGIRVEQNVVTYYLARDANGSPLGVAYFDAHIVRTLDEVLMIVVGTDDTIRRIDVLRFSEPPEYRAPDGWLKTIEGKALDDDLSLKGDVVNLTGASLTAEAVVRAARLVLALHGVIAPFDDER